MIMNQRMKRLMKRRSLIRADKKKMAIEIDKVVSRYTYFNEDGFFWISDKSKSISLSEIRKNYSDLSSYEWDHSEIYFDNKEIRGDFSGSILFVLDYLKSKFLDICLKSKVFVSVSADMGRYKNVVVHFHLFREGELILDISNIEEYAQPVLYEIFGI